MYIGIEQGSKKIAVLVLWDIAYNFFEFVLFFKGYFATEENEEKREIREKQKEKRF